MKLILCLMLALVTVFSLVACGGGSSKDNGSNKKTHSNVSDPDNGDEKEQTYLKALQLMQDKNYDEAVSLLESLGDYKDAKEKIKECKYLKAVQMIAGKNYEMAYNLLAQVKDYQDAADLLGKFVWKHGKAVHSTEAGTDLTTNYTYTYDERGYALTSSYKSQNMENDYTYVNVYDDAGRIKRITSTSTAGYVVIHNYIYNDQGQLSCLSSNYNGAYVQDIYYTYNEQGLVVREETPDTESVTDYTYDDKGNVLTADGNFGTSTYVNTYDASGRLVQYVRTDSNFSTTFSLTYDEHGNLTKEEGVGEDGYVDTWEYSDFNLYYQG